MRRRHSIAAVAAIWIAGLGYLGVQILPQTEVADCRDPDYADRLAAATVLLSGAPGTNEQAAQTIRRAAAGSIEKLRKHFPDAPTDVMVEVERRMRDAAEQSIENQRQGAAHFWARLLPVEDIHFMRRQDDLPY
ncbi:MAG: hypothetical protein AAF415_08440 [Pseudomonadota bacterium]